MIAIADLNECAQVSGTCFSLTKVFEFKPIENYKTSSEYIDLFTMMKLEMEVLVQVHPLDMLFNRSESSIEMEKEAAARASI